MTGLVLFGCRRRERCARHWRTCETQRRMVCRHRSLISVAAAGLIVVAVVAPSASSQAPTPVPMVDLATQQACLRLSLKGVSNVSAGFVANRRTGQFRVVADARYDNTCTLNTPPGTDDGSKRIGIRGIGMLAEMKKPGGRWREVGGLQPILQEEDYDPSHSSPAIDHTHLRTDGTLSVGRLVWRWKLPVVCKTGSLVRGLVFTRWNSLLPASPNDSRNPPMIVYPPPPSPRSPYLHVGAYREVRGQPVRCPRGA